MSTAETLLAALQAALAAAGIGASVERSRVVAIDRPELPAVVIKPKAEESVPFGTGMLRCVLTVGIEVHTRGDVPDQLADPIASAIDAAIRGSAAVSALAAKCFRSAKAWEFADADQAAGQLTIDYQFHYLEPTAG